MSRSADVFGRDKCDGNSVESISLRARVLVKGNGRSSSAVKSAFKSRWILRTVGGMRRDLRGEDVFAGMGVR